jgi:predicted DsbA family dithiol-disulfide isomerase
MTITVNVISDVVCPWCWVGKRRLEKAIAAVAGRHEVVVRWLPYQLNPDMRPEGMERRSYRTAKFGSLERSLELDAKLAAVGAGEGIAFHFDRIERTPNTLDAHRLIRLAGERGVQDAVAEALFRAYFSEGRDISDRTVLLDVAAGAGLARGQAEAELSCDDSAAKVRGEEAEARRLGVESVPFFVLNGQLALTGAREPEAFLAAFDYVVSQKAEAEAGGGESCSGGVANPTC